MLRGLLVLMLLTAGCITPPPPQTPTLTANDQHLAIRNQGYSLLFKLLDDERNVSKLLIVKKEAADLGDLLKDISRITGAAAKQLEAFSKKDSHLHLNMPGLPLAEEQTRHAISKTKARELITKGGQKFEVRIILAQAEALTYGAHLALVTKAHETDPARQQFLQKTSEELQALHQRLIDLIHTRWDINASSRVKSS